MSEQARPVRAWAEYDEIALFWHEDDGQTWLTPKGEGWYPSRFDDVPWIVATMEQLQLLQRVPGPLRSLRVLLSTGHEVELVRKADSVTIPQGRKAVMLDPGCMKFSLFASEGAWLHGGWYMPEVTDADAVARAISEALAWIREQE